MAAETKLDLYRQHKAEYVMATKPVLIEVGPALYLAIEGRGDPNGEEFAARMGALYGAAFTIKMARKFAGLGDYKVCHLEGLWWTDRKTRSFSDLPPRSEWQWKALIRVPEFISANDLKKAKAALAEKGKGPECGFVELETIREGLCVQMLHVGPYSDEPRTLAVMDEFMKAEGLAFRGPHHEIYFSDPCRVAPEKMKTLLRHPVRKGA